MSLLRDMLTIAKPIFVSLNHSYTLTLILVKYLAYQRLNILSIQNLIPLIYPIDTESDTSSSYFAAIKLQATVHLLFNYLIAIIGRSKKLTVLIVLLLS